MLPFWQQSNVTFFISLVVNVGTLWILLLSDVWIKSVIFMYNHELEWNGMDKNPFCTKRCAYIVLILDMTAVVQPYVDHVQFRTWKNRFSCIV